MRGGFLFSKKEDGRLSASSPFQRKSAIQRREEGGTTRSTTKGNYSFDRTIAIHGARSRQGLIINSNLGVRAICDSAPLSTGSNEGRVAGLSLNLARPRVVASLKQEVKGKRDRPYQFLIASRYFTRVKSWTDGSLRGGVNGREFRVEKFANVHGNSLSRDD